MVAHGQTGRRRTKCCNRAAGLANSHGQRFGPPPIEHGRSSANQGPRKRPGLLESELDPGPLKSPELQNPELKKQKPGTTKNGMAPSAL
jgi:hypothetical protein